MPDGIELLGLSLCNSCSILMSALPLEKAQLLLQMRQSRLPLQLTPYVRLLMPLRSTTVNMTVLLKILSVMCAAPRTFGKYIIACC